MLRASLEPQQNKEDLVLLGFQSLKFPHIGGITTGTGIRAVKVQCFTPWWYRNALLSVF